MSKDTLTSQQKLDEANSRYKSTQASYNVKLLLRDQVILEHLLRARVFAVGIEEICFRALHRRDFLWIGRRRRIVWADTELSPYLPYLSALTVDLELQLLRIQNDERLLFLDCITDV